MKHFLNRVNRLFLATPYNLHHLSLPTRHPNAPDLPPLHLPLSCLPPAGQAVAVCVAKPATITQKSVCARQKANQTTDFFLPCTASWRPIRHRFCSEGANYSTLFSSGKTLVNLGCRHAA